jgi:putative alpha-1,2-mannosidase
VRRPRQNNALQILITTGSFGPGRFNYQAFACYDLLDGGKQTLSEYGVWTADKSVVAYSKSRPLIVFHSFGLDAKGLGQTHLNLTLNLIGGVYQSGALFSYDGNPKQINIRVGVSFVSTDQACANAESEVGSSTFEEIQAQAKALWNEKLSKIEIDVRACRYFFFGTSNARLRSLIHPPMSPRCYTLRSIAPRLPRSVYFAVSTAGH